MLPRDGISAAALGWDGVIGVPRYGWERIAETRAAVGIRIWLYSLQLPSVKGLSRGLPCSSKRRTGLTLEAGLWSDWVRLAGQDSTRSLNSRQPAVLHVINRPTCLTGRAIGLPLRSEGRQHALTVLVGVFPGSMLFLVLYISVSISAKISSL